MAKSPEVSAANLEQGIARATKNVPKQFLPAATQLLIYRLAHTTTDECEKLARDYRARMEERTGNGENV